MFRLIAVAAALAGCGRLGFDAQGLAGVDASGAGDADGIDAGPTGWTYVIAGDQTTCAIYLDRAYCWGRGTNREIGDGGNVNRPSPTAVALPAGKVTQLAQGEGHGCAIVGGYLYCWGNAPPGDGSMSSATPVKITSLPNPVTSIACGGGFTCAVAGGNAYCWGTDTGGALGNGASTNTLVTPTQVTLNQAAVGIDAGNDHAMVLLSDGSVWGWGHNDSGALGHGSFSPANSDLPIQAVFSGALPRISGWHACVVDASGAARCWGLGTRGELGDGLSTNSATPVTVTGMASGVSTIMTGGGPTDFDATCAAVGGMTSCWGSGTFGRLGNGTTSDEVVPVPVSGLPNDTVELALGYDHSCARSSSGQLRCWGRGDLGQLGDGANANSFTPVLVPLPQ